MNSFDYVIIGAGLAGAATAYRLTARDAGTVLLVEQEAIAGYHSSGRNAAMIRQCVSDRAIADLTRAGAEFLRNPPANFPVAVEFKRNGSLLLGTGEGWRKLSQDLEIGRQLGVELKSWSPSEAKRRVPVLGDAEFDGAIWCPTDGVVDVHALLSGYLKAAVSRGARIRYSCPVRGIHTRKGRIEVALMDEDVRTGVLINAAGAWANEIAKLAGAAPMPLRPCRRHLYISAPISWVDPKWPFVWDVTHDFYFRPEAGGLLLCGCDQEEMAPGDATVDESVMEMLAEKIQRHLPSLSEVGIKKSWAGFRTLSADGRFIIGWDPAVDGLFWVAGLGGHGVTTSAAVGALAADLVLAGAKAEAADFSPERFLA